MTEAYEDKPKKKSILKIFDLSFEEGYCKKETIRKKSSCRAMNWIFSNNKWQYFHSFYDFFDYECVVPEVGQMYLKFTNELLEEGLITKSNVKSMTEKAIGAFCHDFIAGAKIFKLAREIEFDF